MKYNKKANIARTVLWFFPREGSKESRNPQTLSKVQNKQLSQMMENIAKLCKIKLGFPRFLCLARKHAFNSKIIKN